VWVVQKWIPTLYIGSVVQVIQEERFKLDAILDATVDAGRIRFV
jgi:hypothetical protein